MARGPIHVTVPVDSLQAALVRPVTAGAETQTLHLSARTFLPELEFAHQFAFDCISILDTITKWDVFHCCYVPTSEMVPVADNSAIVDNADHKEASLAWPAGVLSEES